MKRFSKLGKLFAATAGVAAIAASIGLAARPATADEPTDTYLTNTPHITINKTANSVDPAAYPDRFVAIQVFAADADDKLGGDTYQLSNITWGQSVNDVDGLLQAMVKSDFNLGTFNEKYDGPYKDQKWKDANTFGKLFATWLNEKNSNFKGPDATLTGGSTESKDLSDIKSKVTAHEVAEFLDAFAYANPQAGTETSDNEYPSPSPYTSSEVAAAFADIVTNYCTQHVEAKDGWKSQAADVDYWTSMAYDGSISNGATGVGDSLEHGSNKPTDVTTATAWVIDSLYADPDPEGDKSTTANSRGLPEGYYLVIDRFHKGLSGNFPNSQNYPGDGTEGHEAAAGENGHAHGVVSEYMLQVVGNAGAVVNIKADAPSLDKRITGATAANGDADSVAVGDTVNYSLTGTLPENVMSYHDAENTGERKYQLTFIDKLGTGLTLCDASNVHIYVNEGPIDDIANLPGTAKEVDVAQSSAAIEVTATSPNLKVDIKNIHQLKDKEGQPITIKAEAEGAASVFYVTYTATVNDQAVSGNAASETLTNTAKLQFTNDPYTNGTGETPEDKTFTYTYGLDLEKHKNEIGGDPLEGAGFALLQASGDTPGTVTDAATDQGHAGCPTVGTAKVALFTKGGSDEYIFAGWETVTSDMVADAKYVEAHNSEAAHMHAGMLCETLNASKQGIGREGVDSDSVKYYTVLKTNAQGKVNIRGLDKGAYTVIEALTPTGYDVMPKWSFLIQATETENGSTVTFTGNPSSGTLAQIKDEHTTGTDSGEADGLAELDLVNIQGIDLPVTGGMGTALFIGAGVVLVVTACAYTAARKRRAEDAE